MICDSTETNLPSLSLTRGGGKILKILFKNIVHSCNVNIQEAKQEDKLEASLASLMRLCLVKQTQNKQQQYGSRKNV